MLCKSKKGDLPSKQLFEIMAWREQDVKRDSSRHPVDGLSEYMTLYRIVATNYEEARDLLGTHGFDQTTLLSSSKTDSNVSQVLQYLDKESGDWKVVPCEPTNTT